MQNREINLKGWHFSIESAHGKIVYVISPVFSGHKISRMCFIMCPRAHIRLTGSPNMPLKTQFVQCLHTNVPCNGNHCKTAWSSDLCLWWARGSRVAAILWHDSIGRTNMAMEEVFTGDVWWIKLSMWGTTDGVYQQPYIDGWCGGAISIIKQFQVPLLKIQVFNTLS